MRIALVVPGGVDASGTERVIPALLWLIERLATRHDVHVIALHQAPNPGCWPLLGAHVHNIGTTPGRRRRFMATVAALHRERPFDVIHSVFGGTAGLAALAGLRHDVPMLLHLAGGELVGLRDIAYGMQCSARTAAGLRFALHRARCVTVATPYMQRLATARGFTTSLVPLGVALDRWPEAPIRRREGERAVLLHIGDLRPVKDQEMLLDAARRLRDAGVCFELHMAGVDTDDGALRRTPAARALADVVHWHGLLHRPALRALVERAHLLLVTSRHEAGPMAVLEAAVAGVPTVGTAVGHVDELAPHGAVAVPVRDAGALAHEVMLLLGDEPRRLAMAREAQAHAVAHDAGLTAARFEWLYGEVVA